MLYLFLILLNVKIYVCPYQCNHLHCYECFIEYSLFCKKNNKVITCLYAEKNIICLAKFSMC